MATTPLEREILTHYATTAGPYRGGSENWTETHVEIVRRFIDLGLLMSFKGEDGRQHVAQNEPALRLYMAALAAVPLPVQRWVVPAVADAEPGEACSADMEARVAELERQVHALQSDDSRPRHKRYEVEED
jgi:hypothetical protein